jgi:hypothetical protein
MFYQNRWIILFLGILLGGMSFFVCKKSSSKNTSSSHPAATGDRLGSELEYRLIQAELLLVKSDQPYLVINLDRNELELKLKGVVVWNQPIQLIQTATQDVNDFARNFEGEEKDLVRPLMDKFLFTAKNKTPDSVLTIISDAVRAKPELMQRDVPERFQLRWNTNLILEVRTEIIGTPKEKLKSTMLEIRHAIQRPFGEAHIIIKMSPEAALTLYRLAQPGLSTLIYPQMRKEVLPVKK